MRNVVGVGSVAVSLWACTVVVGCGGGAVVPGHDASTERPDAYFERPDAFVPPIDAFVPPVDAFVSCGTEASRTFDVDVIGGVGYPQPVAASPLAGAAVRVAHECGRSMEGTTDASGHVTLTLSGPADGWVITAAKAGYSAVSIADLSASPVGAIRLDQYGVHTFTGVAVSGTVSGLASGAQLTLDSVDFDTMNLSANGPWSTMFYTGGPSGAPLELVAVETSAGHLVDVVTVTRSPRPTTPVSGVAIDLSGTPPAIVTHSLRVTGLPAGVAADTWSVIHYPGTDIDGAYVDAGNAIAVGSSGYDIETTSVVTPSYGFFGFTGGGYRTTYVVRDFGASTETVAAPSASSLGVSQLRDGRWAAQASGVTGDVDALVIDVDEIGNHGPRWRIYCSPTAHETTPCAIPRLPSAVSPADLGLDFTSGPNVLAMLQTAHAGSLWTNSGVPFPSAYLVWQVAGSYDTIHVTPMLAP